MRGNPEDPTDTLEAYTSGDPDAARRLMPLIYKELRARAARLMQAERPGHTLQPTELVHEAFIRLIDMSRIDWKGRTHFLAMAAIAMRRVLVEHARYHGAKKRAGVLVSLNEGAAVDPPPSMDLLALDEGLAKLAEKNPRQAQVAEYRLFAGMLENEIGHALGISERTVRQDWLVARAWLAREIGR